MFKKIKDFLKRMSLTGQLVLILISLSVVVFCFVSPLIESNVQSIVDSQVYSSIVAQQSQIISFYEGENGGKFNDLTTIPPNEYKVRHIVYYQDQNAFEVAGFAPSSEELVYFQHYLFNPLIQNMLSNEQGQTFQSYTLENGSELYFVITQSQIDPDEYWISYAFNDISNDLARNIREELVNVLYGLIILIAVVIIVWVYSMIKPLHQITNYIRAIKQGEKFNLKITRADEIGEVGQALKEMETELNRQNRLQQDLIHNISHDLKTPIAIIRSYCECIQDDIYPYGDLNSSLNVIIENADRLEKKVKDFLYLNRLDYIEEKDVPTEQINVGEIARHLVDELRPLHEEIEFVTEIDENAMFQGANEDWYSCLMNILDNAIRYAKSTIKVTINDDFIEIYNDGSRIDDKLKNEIFEPYTKGPKGNYGLGMSIVYKIVTMYRCTISADNINDGVAFTIKKINV